MTTAEQLAQLREVAERAASDDWGYDHDEFCESLTPGMILALLDELERVTAERDALREGEMGDAKHSDTRAAADIYFQLVEECEIPHGGSLVEYIDTMRERIAELEAISSAAEKLVRCKGRYHSEQNYRALAAMFGVTTPDLPPLESEARTVTVKIPYLPDDCDRTEAHFKYQAAIRAAGVTVEG